MSAPAKSPNPKMAALPNVFCSHPNCNKYAVESAIDVAGNLKWASCQDHLKVNRPKLEVDGKEMTASEALIREAIRGAVDARFELLRSLVVAEITDDVMWAITHSPELLATLRRALEPDNAG